MGLVLDRHWHPKILWFWVWYLGFPPKPKPKPKNPKNPKFKPKPKPRIPKNLGPKTQKLKIFLNISKLGLKISKIKFYG
jgi:hypothetical protein